MSATNIFETSLLELIFNNQSITNVADGLGSAGSFYVSLHVADPGENDSQTTGEASYTSYTRIAVARSPSGWTVLNDRATNTSEILFPLATGGSEIITHFGIGTDAVGTGVLLFSGAFDESLAVSAGIRPAIRMNDLQITVD